MAKQESKENRILCVVLNRGFRAVVVLRLPGRAPAPGEVVPLGGPVNKDGCFGRRDKTRQRVPWPTVPVPLRVDTYVVRVVFFQSGCFLVQPFLCPRGRF